MIAAVINDMALVIWNLGLAYYESLKGLGRRTRQCFWIDLDVENEMKAAS